MSKKETLEKFLNFMGKWHYEDFDAFEKHFNRLMSMKGREQLTSENEALKDSIAVVLAQKHNWRISCEKKDQRIAELEEKLKQAEEEFEEFVEKIRERFECNDDFFDKSQFDYFNKFLDSILEEGEGNGDND